MLDLNDAQSNTGKCAIVFLKLKSTLASLYKSKRFEIIITIFV